MTPAPPIVVSIHCLAYNQEQYIRRTLEGFVMQRTDFRFQAVVHDDASTDATAAIIREFEQRYPDIIKGVYETENQWRKPDGSLERIMAGHIRQAEFVAYCEGDDYWTDPLKLQRQVDYLRAHPDCSVTYTDVRVYHQDTGEMTTGLNADAPARLDTAYLLHRNRVITCSSMIRGEVLRKYYDTFIHYFIGMPVGDYPRWLFASMYGYINHSDELTAVYRMLGESASHSPDPYRSMMFRINIYDIRIIFCRYFHIPGARAQRAKRTFLILTRCLAHGWFKRMVKLLLS